MHERVHAMRVVARTQLKESLLSPGLYVALSLGLVIGWLLCSGFVQSIDSSGFDPRLNGFWDFATRALSGAFGPVFVERLLAEGPFLAILVASVSPILLFLAIGSVFRFGMEKATGAVELFAYGPADGTAYFLGSFIKDAILTAGAIVVLTPYFILLAAVQNLVIGPQFYAALPVVFLLSLSLSAFGILCSTIVSHAAAALALFLAIGVVFCGSMAGSLSASGSSVGAAAEVASTVLQWFSPLHYAAMCARGYGGGSVLGYAGGLVLLAALSAAVLVGSHLLIRRRGVRA
jgi:ABC-type transport system involved in multi-copper enzyme maturation permease subunit